jgi:transposase
MSDCNMHSRRRFVEALDRDDARAALPIAEYKKLHEIEAEIRDKEEDAKLAARQVRRKPIFDVTVAWCQTYKPNEPPQFPLGQAIGYMINHHKALGRFIEHGAIPIDNGIVERLHVRTALTRKNYVFAGFDADGERAAIAYTILACCRLADVESATVGELAARMTTWRTTEALSGDMRAQKARRTCSCVANLVE